MKRITTCIIIAVCLMCLISLIYAAAVAMGSGVLHKTWRTDLMPGTIPSTRDVMEMRSAPDEEDVLNVMEGSEEPDEEQIVDLATATDEDAPQTQTEGPADEENMPVDGQPSVIDTENDKNIPAADMPENMESE